MTLTRVFPILICRHDVSQAQGLCLEFPSTHEDLRRQYLTNRYGNCMADVSMIRARFSAKCTGGPAGLVNWMQVLDNFTIPTKGPFQMAVGQVGGQRSRDVEPGRSILFISTPVKSPRL